MRFALFSAVSLASASVVLAAPDLSHRHHHRALVERQRPNMNNSWSEPPTSSSTAVISSASPSPTARPSSSSATSSAPQSSESTAAPPSSSAATTTAQQPESSAAPASSAQTTSAQAQTSATPQQSGQGGQDVPRESAVSTISMLSSSAAPTSVDAAPTVIASAASTIRSAITPVTTATRTQSTASSSATAAAAAASGESQSSGLSKPALIGIIVGASVVGIAAIAFTLFRKWKLRPSNRFEKRLNAIDFTPKGGYEDDYFEKGHNRSASASSAERHRKALMAEEFESGSGNVAGVPEHDFTAGSSYGMAGAGAGMGAPDMYNSDPFAHAQAYDYGYPPQTYDQYGNPVAVAQAGEYDYPTQDQEYAQGQAQGYADLQRGGSTGSQHQHQHQPRSGSPTAAQPQQVYPNDFPEPGQYLGRPTGGADGPYAQAAQYRGY